MTCAACASRVERKLNKLDGSRRWSTAPPNAPASMPARHRPPRPHRAAGTGRLHRPSRRRRPVRRREAGPPAPGRPAYPAGRRRRPRRSGVRPVAVPRVALSRLAVGLPVAGRPGRQLVVGRLRRPGGDRLGAVGDAAVCRGPCPVAVVEWSPPRSGIRSWSAGFTWLRSVCRDGTRTRGSRDRIVRRRGCRRSLRRWGGLATAVQRVEVYQQVVHGGGDPRPGPPRPPAGRPGRNADRRAPAVSVPVKHRHRQAVGLAFEAQRSR